MINKMIEYIRTQSGAWYSVSENDMEHFVRDTKNVLQKYINNGSTVGLFIDLDDANLNSMIIYKACKSCGAATIRCGVSDLDRQLQVMNNIFLDVLICTCTAYKYLKNKVKHDMVIIVESITKYYNRSSYQDTIRIYEYFDIPGFAIMEAEQLHCPGYDVNIKEDKITLNAPSYAEEYSISNYVLETQRQETLTGRVMITDYAHAFIMMQIQMILRELLNGKIDALGNITLNSIGMVELLVFIEEKFDISIELEKINKNSFENLFFLSDLIYNTLKEGETVDR